MPLKSRLLTPGPTMIPERVLQKMALPILHHRSPEFKPVFQKAQSGLKKLFQTECDVLMLAASGSGAMEATMVNLFSPGEKIVVVEAGKFGQRWKQLGESFGMEVVAISLPWGEAVKVEQIEEVVNQHGDVQGLFLQASETSTGVAHPLEKIVKWRLKEHPELLLCVDGITAVGSTPLPMDEWGIDALVTGSQKALMLPPGLGLVSFSDKAWIKVESIEDRIPSYYFDLKKELKAQKDQTTTAWTPAVSLITGLVEALDLMEEEGWDALYERHRRLAHATRAAGTALGLKLLAADAPSTTITAFHVPEGVDGSALVKEMRDRHGYTIAGGQNQLKGKIFRFGHMGFVDVYDLVGGFAALEKTLKDLGWKQDFEWGTSTGALMQAYGDEL